MFGWGRIVGCKRERTLNSKGLTKRGSEGNLVLDLFLHNFYPQIPTV